MHEIVPPIAAGDEHVEVAIIAHGSSLKAALGLSPENTKRP
jgi:hypothetical protein